MAEFVYVVRIIAKTQEGADLYMDKKLPSGGDQFVARAEDSLWLQGKLTERWSEGYTRGVDDTRTNMLAPTRATYIPEPKYRRNGW